MHTKTVLVPFDNEPHAQVSRGRAKDCRPRRWWIQAAWENAFCSMKKCSQRDGLNSCRETAEAMPEVVFSPPHELKSA